MRSFLEVAIPPHRLSGTVYGTLLNDPATLAALGDAVHAAPYKAPPRAPVLYLKPRHTLAPSGAVVEVPADVRTLEIGATVGIIIGHRACRLQESEALAHVAGWILVADLSVPHRDFYRPSVRLRARDHSCLIGPRALARAAIADSGALELSVLVDGMRVQTVRTDIMTRSAARLLCEVTDFMTLRRGDLLLLGLAEGAPQVTAGQRFAIEAPGLGRLTGSLASEEVAGGGSVGECA